MTRESRQIDGTVTFDDNPESLSALKPFFKNISEVLALNGEFLLTIRSAVDEAVTNVVKHGFTDRQTDEIPEITLNVKTEKGTIRFVITDNGIPFNPLEYGAPDISDISRMDVMDIQLGGLGIPMMKLAFDELHYERTDGHNILTLTKKI